jgi:hypothetical protein
MSDMNVNWRLCLLIVPASLFCFLWGQPGLWGLYFVGVAMFLALGYAAIAIIDMFRVKVAAWAPDALMAPARERPTWRWAPGPLPPPAGRAGSLPGSASRWPRLPSPRA